MGIKGKQFTIEHKAKIASALKNNRNGVFGKGIKKPKHTEQWKREASQRMVLENKKRLLEGRHNLWLGGKTKEIHRLRTTLEYKLWRKAVFERDNYTCIWCNQRGGNLNADHIKPLNCKPVFSVMTEDLLGGTTFPKVPVDVITGGIVPVM